MKYELLLEDIRGEKRFDEPLARYCSLHIGGKADLLVFPNDVEDLALLRELCSKRNIPLVVIGFGTNILFMDKGFRGVVASLRKGFGGIRVFGKNIYAGAGVALKEISKTATAHSLAGLEFAAGIPGSFGGAVIMNAGTDIGEIKDVLRYADIVDANGVVRKVDNKDIQFDYRGTGLPDGTIVLGGELSLIMGDRIDIEKRITISLEERKRREPTYSYNAGSVFKNPPGDFAGRLIDKAGMKGFRVGGVKVSDSHANFIVNDAGGSAYDVLILVKKIKERVWKESGLALEEEIRVIG